MHKPILISWMTTKPPANRKIMLKMLGTHDFENVERFYFSVGYHLSINPADKFFAAYEEETMVGLVRLALENGITVLRGMQIHPQYQFLGIGTQLIKLLETHLENQVCYCLPHNWLNRFYSQIGFEEIVETKDAPQFLRERLENHRKKYPQLIMMKRSGLT